MSDPFVSLSTVVFGRRFFRFQALFAAPVALAFFALAQPAQGGPPAFGVYREQWTNLNSSLGNTLTALTNTTYNPNWPNNPNPAATRIFTTFETEINSGVNYYGQRVRAFVVPPVSGIYTFWIASDDTSQLFLSTDENPAHKTAIAGVTAWTSSENWTEYATQQSAPISLQGGSRYYIEAIMQQGTGGDNLSVRWRLPDGVFEQPMSAVSPAGTLLVPFNGVNTLPGIFSQPTNMTAVEGLNATFSLLVTNQAPVSYQWLVNGTNLNNAGATQPFYTVPNVNLSLNNGQFYSCIVSNSSGSITSAPAMLTVIRDTVPPTVVRVFNFGVTNVEVLFSKPVEPASATNTANYVFTNGLTITGASLGADNVTVTLTTSPLVYGSNYSMVINGVRDRAATPNTIAPNTPASFVALPYVLQDIGNPPFPSALTLAGNGVTVSGGGNDVGGSADQFTFSYQSRTGDFDVSVRLAGMALSDVWAKAGLMARASLDAGSPFAASFATPSLTGCFFEYRSFTNGSSSMVGSFPANYPNTWLRLKRVGNLFTGYAGYDGQAWTTLGSVGIVMPSQIFLGLSVSSYNSSQTTTAQFQNFADVTNAVVAVVTNPHEPIGPSSRRSPIVISEIMYKPAPRADTNNLEYLELYNSNPWFQDISGYQLVCDNLSYTFPAGTVLAGGAYLVVAASPASIQNVYGITNVMGPYTGSLKKSGTLQLLDEQGAVLLIIPYSNANPWPVAADGTGHSLVLANPTYGEGDPRAWDISDVAGGSPGVMETFRPSPLRSVVINEFLAHTDPPFYDYIELYNHSLQTVDLSGCILTDDPNTNRFVIPAGTLVPPRGFAVFYETNMGFGLKASGQTIYFRSPGASRVLDAVSFEGQEHDLSMGRWPDGAGDFYPLVTPTPGTNNSAILIRDIVINELMYKPISGNDDDQYVELYNKGANVISLAAWRFVSGIKYTFPTNASLGPNSYLVIGRNITNLFANYTNLNSGNTLGNFRGKLSHKGDRLALAMPDELVDTNTLGQLVTNTSWITIDEVTWRAGGRWGQWSSGGGSSLELINPNTDHRLADNWADSDETMKSVWTNLEFTGVLDNGANYHGTTNVDLVQLGLTDVGECLVDNVEVRPGGPLGANIVSNSDFESGPGGWVFQGDHIRTSLETASGLGGYQSTQSLHLRSGDGFRTLADKVQCSLTQTTLSAGQIATLRLKARWLRGWQEILMRLRGNWLEVDGVMPVPANLGTPGMRNSRFVTNAAPAIYEVKHSPPIPAAGQAVVVTARFHSLNPFQPTLRYRVDGGVNPNPTYTSVPMVDNGTSGDIVAGDGIYSATIPGESAGAVVAFLVQAQDVFGAATIFPADPKDNSGLPRECSVGFGDPIPTGTFNHEHVFITQNWAQRWSQLGGVAHEYEYGTWVDGGGRIVYNWAGRYAGSPYHQFLGSPVTTIGGMHWIVPDDDQIRGTANLNKQHVPGNGPLDDNTIQREQTSWWMARQIGLSGGENRRYYFLYLNGYRHAPLMEDTQVPGADTLKEYWPDDNNGPLFKNDAWMEGDVVQQSDGYMNFDNKSWCTLGKYTTTINGVPNQYKLARYRWPWGITAAADAPALYALIDAANTPTNSAAYYANMESQVDTEGWIRMSAMEHATGDWDSFFTQNQWNMYCYKPAMNKWTVFKFDWNITLGSGTQSWPPDGSQLFNYGGNDPIMGAFQNYPAYHRAYLRAFQDIANLAMNNALVDQVLDAKYAAFAANGLTANSTYGLLVQDPGGAGLKAWIGRMHNSLLAALTNNSVVNIPFAINSSTISGDTAIITGTAPLAVKTLWFNGAQWPLTWTSTTAWRAVVPLKQGTNTFSVVGVDRRYQPIGGATNTVSLIYNGVVPSPVGMVAINEIMYNPAVPGAGYIELYNSSPGYSFDLSGWQLPGLDYTFPAGSLIAPNNFLVLAANRSAFSAAYGGTIPMFDTFPGTLQTNGETLSLLQPGTNGTLVVAGVKYEAVAPWPLAASGSSLQLLDARQDNWRAGNWAVAQTGAPQWVYVTASGVASTSTLYIYLQSAGDVYIDDLKLVAGNVPDAGANVLADGGFESGFPGPWVVSPNLSASSLSATIKHSGNASLHVIASSGGTTRTSAIYQDMSPTLVTNQPYTLSFWYLQSTNGGPLVVRLSGSGIVASVNPAPPAGGAVPASATPDATNSVIQALSAFPPLWLNELQADNLTGITNSAGQRVPWLELYNPTTNTVSLSGVYLANDYSNLTDWAFPAGAAINPGQFKVIFADGQTGLSTLNEAHTSFVLPSGAGSLALSRLYNGQPQVLDYINYTNLTPNRSYGSLPDGQSFVRQEFFFPTPGGTNNAVGNSPPSFIAYDTPGALYTQNFDALPDPGAVSVNTANPVTINGITYSLANPFDFAFPVIASGNIGGLGINALSGWYGLADPASMAGTRFGATDGDQTTGGQVSFGLPGSGNRALGLLATSTTGFTGVGAKFINQTTQSLNYVTLRFTGEVWRQSDLPKTLEFYYFIDPTAMAAFSTNYTAFLPGLNVSFPTVPGDVGGAAVDGTAAVNQTNLGVFNQVITNWPPGGALWLVWEMASAAGKSQGLAIDDLSFSASDQPMSAPAPALTIGSAANNPLVLSWPGAPGWSYQVEYKTNLTDLNWIAWGGPLAGNGATLSLTNPPDGATQRFFRVRVVFP